MEEIRILLGETVFSFRSEIPLGLGGSLAQFQSPGAQPHYQIHVRYARPGEPTPHRDGFASICREGCRFELALSDRWPEPSVWQMLSMLPLSALLLEHGTMLLHASYILHNGEAIVFSGPSGIGKSTQAELWRRCRNARILNGDRILLTPKDGHVLVHSHYLSGTSGICENLTAKLRALVLLGQAEHNRAYPPGPLDAFRRILGQADYDPRNRDQMIRITALAETLLAQARICCLDCTPEESAVNCLENDLYEEFRNPNHS